MKISKDRIAVSVLAGVVLVLFFATIAGLFYYRSMIRSLDEVQEEAYAEYTRLYAYIAEDPESKISNRIYKEISEYAQENASVVEQSCYSREKKNEHNARQNTDCNSVL